MTDTTIGAGSAALFRPGTSDAEIEASAMKAMKRRTALVRFWQIAILVFVIGMWELSSNMQWIDPFFYSSPSGVIERLYEWATEGTTEGSLWYNLWVTMEEALIGFLAHGTSLVFAFLCLAMSLLAVAVTPRWLRRV